MQLNIFIPDPLFEEIKAISRKRNTDIGDLIIEALEYYVEISKYD
ncbi:hypothetical protein [Acidianus brierleyi]|nr:hypothetical protein [Acidianus brierleyi]